MIANSMTLLVTEEASKIDASHEDSRTVHGSGSNSLTNHEKKNISKHGSHLKTLGSAHVGPVFYDQLVYN